MKKINYLWYGLTSFMEGYVPFLGLLTTIATAFAVSVFFPAITIFIFAIALLIGGGLALREIKAARKKNELMQELREQFEKELREKVKLKKQFQHNKEHYEELLNIVNHANRYKQMLQKTQFYCDHFYEKIQHMQHDECEVFLRSQSWQQINNILATFQRQDISEEKFEHESNEWEQLIKPIIGQVDATFFTPTSEHSSNNQSFNCLFHKVKPVSLEKSPATKRASVGITIKTSLLSFAFASSVSAVTIGAIVGLSPVVLIAAFPIAAITISCGFMALAIGLGVSAGLINHQVIAPQKVYLKKLTERLPLLKQRNHELSNTLELEKTLIIQQQQHLKEIEEDNELLRAQVIQKSESLHKQLDQEYYQTHKLTVNDALHIANHPQIKDISSNESYIPNIQDDELKKVLSRSSPALMLSL